MSDLAVVAFIKAKPGSADVVRDALRDLVTATRRDETGCLSYELNESAATPGTFITVESWVDQGALDAHLQTPHLQAALAAAGEHMAEPPAIHPLMPVA